MGAGGKVGGEFYRLPLDDLSNMKAAELVARVGSAGALRWLALRLEMMRGEPGGIELNDTYRVNALCSALSVSGSLPVTAGELRDWLDELAEMGLIDEDKWREGIVFHEYTDYLVCRRCAVVQSARRAARARWDARNGGDAQ